jgi:hypothetical protein
MFISFLSGCEREPRVVYSKFNITKIDENKLFLDVEIDKSAVNWAKSNGLIVDVYSSEGGEGCSADFDPITEKINLNVEKKSNDCVLFFLLNNQIKSSCKLTFSGGSVNFFASSFLETGSLSSGEPIMDGRSSAMIFEVSEDRCSFVSE